MNADLGDRGARPRLRVGVVGAGRAGSVLGAALARAGHQVVAVHGVSDVSRLRAEALLPGVSIKTASEAAAGVDLVMLTVPDDVLADVAAGLVAHGAITGGQIVAHVSGRHGLAVLEPATAVGAVPIAMHPAMTFTGTSLDLGRLAGTRFGITAPDSAVAIAQALVVEMGGEPVMVPDGSRALYHAALAHGANHLVTLVAEASELLALSGVDDPSAVLGPLLSAALDNALRRGDQALTGPVARGDAQTVVAHLAAIAARSPAAASSYRVLARLTADRAIQAGLLPANRAEDLLTALADGTDVSERPLNDGT